MNVVFYCVFVDGIVGDFESFKVEVVLEVENCVDFCFVYYVIDVVWVVRVGIYNDVGCDGVLI